MLLDKTISQKKRFLASCIKKPLMQLASECADYWREPQRLAAILKNNFDSIPECRLLYCFDTHGRQYSSQTDGRCVNDEMIGRLLNDRPYFHGLLPYQGLALSSIYLSQHSNQPCITAICAVRYKDTLLGFVAADFALHSLPGCSHKKSAGHNHWMQYKGDPAIRGTVFMQQRAKSLFDERLDRLVYILATLIEQHGIFHMQVDFSGSRVTLWSIESPFDFQVLTVEQLFANNLMQNYTQQCYPNDAVVEYDRISTVLMRFKALRMADETLYLRNAMINIINGMIGLTFSCDGFHLMSVDEFLAKDIKFWFGSSAVASDCWAQPAETSLQESA